MSGDDLAAALQSGGEAWLVLSIAAVLPILWSFTLVMHFARPYVVRFLQTLTLRFGGDVWWLSYVLIRDGLLVITLGLSAIFLFPNLYLTVGLPITAPLATVVLFWALVVKLIRDPDDDLGDFRIVSALLVVASALYIVPQIYGMEAADQEYLGDLPSALISTENLALARPILWLSLGPVHADRVCHRRPIPRRYRPRRRDRTGADVPGGLTERGQATQPVARPPLSSAAPQAVGPPATPACRIRSMPEIDFAFLADAAETVPGQKFHVIGGGISRIGGRTFPLRQPHICLVVGLTVTASEVDREHQIRFVLLDPDGREVTGATGSLTAHGSNDGRDSLLTFSIDLWNVTFPAAGDYSVRILVNGSERKRLPLLLIQRAEPTEGPQIHRDE